MLPTSRWMIFPAIFSALALLNTSAVRGETPASPRVKKMVAAGITYLQNPEVDGFGVGGKALIAYTLLKAGSSTGDAATQKRVSEAVEEVRRAIKSYQDGENAVMHSIYTPCIALMFLCELDSRQFQNEIQWLLDHLLERQQSDGSFGYHAGTGKAGYGDTSQIQYAVLAFWYADKNNFEIPLPALQGCMNWLIRTQQANGGFAYHIPINARGPKLHEDRWTLGNAGVGTLYILSDIGGLNPPPVKRPSNKGGQTLRGLPATVTVYIDREKERKNKKPRLDPTGLDVALKKGNRWVEDNYHVEVEPWYLYAMYAYERMAAFSDLARGEGEEEPDWYNEGVALLEQAQEPDGGWVDKKEQYPAAQTCFAILFLIRSSKAAVAKYTEGRLQGGGEINSGTLVIGRDGKVKGVDVTKSVDDLLNIPEDAAVEDWVAFRKNLNGLKISDDPKKRKKDLEQLRYLTSHKSFQARIIAVEQLARRRDFESIPNLIYSLGDPDKRVAVAGHNSLRVLSRRFDLPEISLDEGLEKTESDEKKLGKLKSDWKKWYRTIKPDAVFMD